MRTPTDQLTLPELVGALDAVEVPFLAGGIRGATLPPKELLKSLARAPEARLRSAIIPLLLRHPQYSEEALKAESDLTGADRATLECFYTAAVFLQRQLRPRFTRLYGEQMILQDWFSARLGLAPSLSAEEGLRAVGERHAELTGLRVNWVGTYQHAAERFIRHSEVIAQWDHRLLRPGA